MSQLCAVEIVTEFLHNFERFDFAALPALLDENVRFLLPTAPAGVPRETVGKDAVMELLSGVTAMWQAFSFSTCSVHALDDDAARVVAEYTSEGLNVDGSRYHNTYATLAEVRGGKVVVYQEFFDPEPVVNALSILTAAAS